MDKVKTVFLMSLLLIIASVFLANCQKESKNQIIVVFASSSSRVLRDGSKIHLKRGTPLSRSDVILTESGSVDLQTSKGSLIRIQNFSKVKISQLGKSTNLDLTQGSLMAKVNRQNSTDSFEVNTPTLIAGVRGTTFSIDAQSVRVVSGKVAIKPRLRASQSKKESYSSQKDLQELEKNLDDQERIIEPGQEGSINEGYLSKIEKINESLEKNKSLKKFLVESKKSSIEIAPNESVLKDKAEEATLVGVSNELLNKSIDTKSSQVGDLEKEIAKEYNVNRDLALDHLEKETLKDIDVKNEADIKKYYSLVEKVNTRNKGPVYVGAVLAQAGGVLVVHTAKGLKRVLVKDVTHIDYQ